MFKSAKFQALLLVTLVALASCAKVEEPQVFKDLRFEVQSLRAWLETPRDQASLTVIAQKDLEKMIERVRVPYLQMVDIDNAALDRSLWDVKAKLIADAEDVILDFTSYTFEVIERTKAEVQAQP